MNLVLSVLLFAIVRICYCSIEVANQFFLIFCMKLNEAGFLNKSPVEAAGPQGGGGPHKWPKNEVSGVLTKI